MTSLGAADDLGVDEAAALALLRRARSLAGTAVADLPTVGDLDGKGRTGQRLERALGLEPRGDDVDDPVSGVELKTLPLMVRGGTARVLEGTFVTSATAEQLAAERWHTSRVWRKLRAVLFVPVVRQGRQDSGVIGTGFLWRPDADEELILRADWEDLADLVARGLGFAVTAHRGRWLQLRPKARDATVVRTVDVVGEDGVVLRPQGFYLRQKLTAALVRERLDLQVT